MLGGKNELLLQIASEDALYEPWFLISQHFWRGMSSLDLGEDEIIIQDWDVVAREMKIIWQISRLMGGKWLLRNLEQSVY